MIRLPERPPDRAKEAADWPSSSTISVLPVRTAELFGEGASKRTSTRSRPGREDHCQEAAQAPFPMKSNPNTQRIRIRPEKRRAFTETEYCKIHASRKQKYPYDEKNGRFRVRALKNRVPASSLPSTTSVLLQTGRPAIPHVVFSVFQSV